VTLLSPASVFQTVSIVDISWLASQNAQVEPIYRAFGRSLRSARREVQLTQETLGKRVGLSRTSITNIERGNQHVGLHLLYDLAKAVGVRPAELLPDEQEAVSDGPSLNEVLAGMRPSDRAKVEREIKRLSEDDVELVQNLVRAEAARDA
jgi:transcriptional regulator with XRE-family HTH domain